VIGGLLVESLGWRSIFFVNAPVCVFAIWLVLRRTSETRLQERKRHFDGAGQTLAIVALLALTAAVIEAGPRGWGSGIVLGGLGVALIAGAGFLFVESRTREPMLPLFFFRRPAFSAASAVGLLVNLAFYGVIFVLSLYFQQERGFSAARTGFAFLPLTAVVTISNIAAGSIAARLGPRLPMVIGLVTGAVGFGLLSRLGPDSGYAAMIPGLILIPLGIGLAVPPMTSALLSTVDRQHSGVASGVLNTVRQAGGAIGVALFGAITAQAGARIDVSYAISAACLLAAAVIAAIGILTPARGRDA
jgi:DHA2 family methylenomycin A resistance protein-like MFS transporter